MASRVRDVKTPMQYGGKQCGSTGESKQCNVDACEKDCVLHSWTKWTSCSKDCDGGSKKRERMIKERFPLIKRQRPVEYPPIDKLVMVEEQQKGRQ